MEKRKAVYAASLDPITNGHMNVVERVAPLYDELVVLVAVDPRKKYMFSVEERAGMVRESVAHLSNVSVDVCVGRYAVKYTEEIGARVVIRGVRNASDMEAEQILAGENRQICPVVETVWVPCLPELAHVSSSLVKIHIGADLEWREQVRRLVPEPVLRQVSEKYVSEKARQHWQTLMEMLGNPQGAETIFEEVVARYGESHRAYHTLEHVVSMLDEFEAVARNAKNTAAVKLAIWYHDIVYDVGFGDKKIASNEEQSAYHLEQDAKVLGLDDVLNACVQELILVTKHDSRTPSGDSAILVDLDLAILGRPSHVFDEYERGIRQEYSHISDTDFRVGRRSVLQNFLNRSSIYATDHFRKTYEHAARENLAWSIARLQ